VWGLAEGLNGFLRMDANHVGGSWSDFRPSYVFTRYIDDYEIANLRIGVEAEDNAWGVYAFVNNLFDDTAITRSTSNAIAQNRTLVNSVAPRTVGLNFRANF
jgi:outer membrane receptor protein involved in Fe transport